MLRPASSYISLRPAAIHCMGDSLTDYNGVYGYGSNVAYPAKIQTLLAALYPPISSTWRNYGLSGDTTPGMIGRLAQMYEKEIPLIAIFWGGTNDSVGTCPAAVGGLTRSGTVGTFIGSRNHGYLTGDNVTISGAVQTAYNISANVTVIDAKTFTYPGVTGSPATPATTVTAISAAFSLPLTRTRDNLIAMAETIGDLQVTRYGKSRIIIIGQHYVNGAGYDTLATPYAAWDAATGLRFYQNAAVTSLNTAGYRAFYFDNYFVWRAPVLTTTEAVNAGSRIVSTGPTNYHPNALGWSTMASGLLTALPTFNDADGTDWQSLLRIGRT